MVEWGRPQMTIWRMRILCWTPIATNTLSEYFLIFHCNNDYKTAPQCYVKHTLPNLLNITLTNFVSKDYVNIRII